MNKQTQSMLLSEYLELVKPTDGMPEDLAPVLFGLYGEVGGVMSTSKKAHREKSVYRGRHRAAVDELGDVLWYLAAIARRLHVDLEKIFMESVRASDHERVIAASDFSEWPLVVASRVAPVPDLDTTLLALGQCAGELLNISKNDENVESRLASFVECYVRTLQSANIAFGEVARANAVKTRGAFLEVDLSRLPTFDSEFEQEEQIPRSFTIVIAERKSGRSFLRWNDVFIGDPLTDSIKDKDGYRFHDVFHLAHAAVLHWSPVFRALIKQKRKSNPQVDEAEDGGRAIVVEEGLTAWLFSQAKDIGFFEHDKKVSLDLLKTVQKFVAGYEVQDCPLKLWESAILQGYQAFLKVRENNGGILVGDRDKRTLTYKPLTEAA